MKLIFITREGYNLSGARVRCYNFARMLREYGIEADVFSFADNLGAKYGEREFEMHSREKIKYDIKALRLLIKEDKNCIFFIQRLNYHSFPPWLVSLCKGNKIIFDCDDWNIRENPEYYLGFIPSSKMEFLTRIIAKYSTICIAASSFLKDYLSSFNKKVFYIPTGVDTGQFRPEDIKRYNNGEINLSWIGTLYHEDMYQNLKFIIDAFATLADKYKNVFLRLAGEGKYFKKLKKDIENNPYRQRIKIDSWIHPSKIPEYLGNIDIGLLSLIKNTKFNRAKSPTKLFEYMAMGKPVVASNRGEANLVLEDGKDGFLAKDRRQFLEKMGILIEDADLRLRMGKSARKKIEQKYSLSVLGSELHKIITREFK